MDDRISEDFSACSLRSNSSLHGPCAYIVPVIPVHLDTQTGNGPSLIPHKDREWGPHSTHGLGMGPSSHTWAGNGTLIPHMGWEWDPHSTHGLGMGPSSHTWAGNGTLIPHMGWEWDPHSTHGLGMGPSFISQTGNGAPLPTHTSFPKCTQ